MKKFLSLFAIIGILVCLSACNKPNGNAATPGNLTTNPPHVLHTDTSGKDVSADYLKRLCTYAWLDTTDMTFIKLAEDGTFFCAEDEELEKTTGEGTWKMLQDSEGYLSLRIQKDSGSAYTMYEVELYDQSLYAYGENDFLYLWLLCDPET